MISYEEARAHYLRIGADADGESHLDVVTLAEAVAPAERGVASLVVSDPGLTRPSRNGAPVDRVTRQ